MLLTRERDLSLETDLEGEPTAGRVSGAAVSTMALSLSLMVAFSLMGSLLRLVKRDLLLVEEAGLDAAVGACAVGTRAGWVGSEAGAAVLLLFLTLKRRLFNTCCLPLTEEDGFSVAGEGVCGEGTLVREEAGAR